MSEFRDEVFFCVPSECIRIFCHCLSALPMSRNNAWAPLFVMVLLSWMWIERKSILCVVGHLRIQLFTSYQIRPLCHKTATPVSYRHDLGGCGKLGYTASNMFFRTAFTGVVFFLFKVLCLLLWLSCQCCSIHCVLCCAPDFHLSQSWEHCLQY